MCRDRLKNAKGVAVRGLPGDMQSAQEFAQKDRFAFEQWAISCLPGFQPNDKQTADGGVDGRGYLLYAPKDNGAEKGMCIAQVKSGKVTPDAIRALLSQLTGKRASVGVLITLDKLTVTPTIRKAIQAAGVFQLPGGVGKFNRLVLWSIREYFNNEFPPLAPMAHPRTGKPMHAEIQSDGQGDGQSDRRGD